MWYEMIPAAFLSGGLLCLPQLLHPHLNKWLYGTTSQREFSGWFPQLMNLRDYRLNNDYYKKQGLEALPDA